MAKQKSLAAMANYALGEGWLARVRREKLRYPAIRHEIQAQYDCYDLPEHQQDHSVRELADYVFARAWR